MVRKEICLWHTLQPLPSRVWKLQKTLTIYIKNTAKGNLVALITNGTAVLGHGVIWPEVTKIGMEGKGLFLLTISKKKRKIIKQKTTRKQYS